MSEEKRGRGRPRPEFTVERDQAVLRHLAMLGSAGRQRLADDFGVNVNIIYLSLIRLRRDGLVKKVRNGKYHLWTVVERA